MVHNCIKKSCKNKYEDEDTDAYYCPSCREENKKVAEKINKTIRPVMEESSIKRYDEAPKGPGGFPNASDFI